MIIPNMIQTVSDRTQMRTGRKCMKRIQPARKTNKKPKMSRSLLAEIGTTGRVTISHSAARWWSWPWVILPVVDPKSSTPQKLQLRRKLPLTTSNSHTEPWPSKVPMLSPPAWPLSLPPWLLWIDLLFNTKSSNISKFKKILNQFFKFIS